LRALRAAVLSAALVSVLVAGDAAAAPSEPISSSGRWLTDAQGRVVVFHGVNMVTKRAPHLPSDSGFGADDAAYLASEGFNTVRLGFGYGAIEPAPDSYDSAFLSAIADEAQVAAGQGLYVLADVHQDQYTDRYRGNGMPDWMALDDGQPNTNQAFPFGYFSANPALVRAFDNFWANVDGPDGDPLQEHYAEGLRLLGAEMAGNSGLLGYDLFNEPYPGSQVVACSNPSGCAGPGEFDATLLSDFTDRAIGGLRAGDRRHLAFYEPNLFFDFAKPTGHRDPVDANTALSFHNYCFSEAAGGSTVGCDAEEARTFDYALAHSAATGSPPLMTEFGATNDPAVMERLAAAADRKMTGWHYWTYSNVFAGNDSPATSLILDLDQPPTPGNIKQPAMDVLARPYPQVVAGTPTSWSFAPASKVFDLSYSTTAPGGAALSDPGSAASTSEIALPARHYPSGYAVQVLGGQVTSMPGARTLTVQPCAGSPDVKVTVAPGPGAATAGCAARCATLLRPVKKRKRVLGTAAGEWILGSKRPERLVALEGDDCLSGKGGRDRLAGGDGDDTLKGGTGRNILVCGPGADVAIAAARDKVSRTCEKVFRKKGPNSRSPS
jgi:endoglycosylceramidase